MNAKQSLLSAVAKNGWHLTTESIDDFLQEKSNLNSTELVKLALDVDLRSIGAKYLPDNVATGRAETFEGPAVLQLAKLRNIAAPKENESSMSATPMYRLTLTDGAGNCNALVIDNDVNGLNINTPPGTKILLKGTIKLKSNLLILNSQNVQVLGGHVDHLVTKWKQAKELSQHVRVANLTETAPPPWVPFGARQTNQVDTSKKVFAQNETQDQEDGSEFSLARQAALAEAMEAKLKITKTFTQTTVDKSQIENAAALASNETRVQSSAAFTRAHNSTSISSGGGERGKPAGRGRGRRGRNFDDDDDDPREAKDAAKPATITLFDLIKTKVDIKGGEDEPAPKEAEREEPTRFIEDSRRGGYSRGGRNEGSRGGRGRGRGSRSYQQGRSDEFNASSAKKQVYDADDFAYELGDTTKVKDLKQAKSNSAAKSAKASETEAPTVTSKSTASANTNESNRNRGDRDNRANRRNRDYTDQNSYDNNRPESSNYKGRNYNPKYNEGDRDREDERGGYRRSEQASYESSGPRGASNYNNDQPTSYTNKPPRSKNYTSSNAEGPSNYNRDQEYYQPPASVSQASNKTGSKQNPPPQQLPQAQIIYQQPQQGFYDYYQPAQLMAVPVNQPYYPPMIPVQIPPSYGPNPGGYYAPADNMYAQGGYDYSNPPVSNRPQREPRLWKAGDQCLAKYHDNEYYPAVIQKVIKNGNRFIVNYTEYDETNEVGLNDIEAKAYHNSNKNKNYNNNRSAQPSGYSNNSRRNNND